MESLRWWVTPRSWTVLRSQPRPLLAVAFALAQLMDIFTTHFGLAAGAQESNPVASFVLRHSGEGALYALKLAVIVTIVAILARSGRLRPGVVFTVQLCTVLVAVVDMTNTVNIVHAVGF